MTNHESERLQRFRSLGSISLPPLPTHAFDQQRAALREEMRKTGMKPDPELWALAGKVGAQLLTQMGLPPDDLACWLVAFAQVFCVMQDSKNLQQM